MHKGTTLVRAFLLAFSFLLFIQSTNVVASTSFLDNMEALLKNKENAVRYANTNVKGKVLEAGTKEPLIGASVMIKGTIKGDATDADGEFTINNVDAGTQTLVVSYIGYNSKEILVELTDNEDFYLEIELEWQGIEGEEVIVSAQVKGQVAAINQQRSSNTISNIVSKDRINELPDVNAAESIGRLPGVSLQRSGGEANKIVIRGLSPKYNTVTVNGMRVPSTDTQNRSVDLSLISSNMLDGIEVTKALTPDKDGDAFGGTVDLKIRNASEGLSGDFQMQGGYTALQNTYNNYKFVGSLGNRFFDNKLGVIVNFNTDRYDRSGDFLSGTYDEKFKDDEYVIFPAKMTFTEQALTRSRLGGSAIIDYKIPEGKVVFNTIYNKLTNEGFTRVNDLDYLSRLHRYRMTEGYNDTYITANSINIEQDFDWIQYDMGVSFTTSSSKSPEDYESEFMEDNAAEASFSEDTLKPKDLTSLFYNDIDNTGLFGLSKSWRETKEEEKGAFANVKIPFQITEQVVGYVKFGGKYRSLTRSNDQNELASGSGPYYGGGSGIRNAIAEAYPDKNLVGLTHIPLSAFQGLYSNDDFLNGDYPLGYSIDPSYMRELTQIAIDGGFMKYFRNGSLGQDYEGEEEFHALYGMTEFNFGEYITLMPGVRWEGEKTDYTAKFSTALEPALGDPLESVSYRDTSTSRSNDFFLPMVHLQIKPVNWVNLRLAYTHSISRPDFRQFAPITYFSFIGNYANAPNKELETSKSINYDASLSVYRNKLGFFTASVFYKEIQDLIWGISFYDVPGQQILPSLEIAEAGGKPIKINTSINNPNLATLKGYELDWQTNFWYLPSIFKGLVLNVNYTHIKSETEIPYFTLEEVPIVPAPRRPPFSTFAINDTTYSRTLADQPSDILNLTVGYDIKGFSARVSLFYQVGTTLGTGSILGTYDDTFKEDYYRIDVSLKQQLPNNFQVYANLNNLNGAGEESYQSPTYRYPTNQQFYGFTMDLGVRYKF